MEVIKRTTENGNKFYIIEVLYIKQLCLLHIKLKSIFSGI